MTRYTIERLGNGLVRLFDRSTLLVMLFNADGTQRSGPACSAYAQVIVNDFIRGIRS